MREVHRAGKSPLKPIRRTKAQSRPLLPCCALSNATLLPSKKTGSHYVCVTNIFKTRSLGISTSPVDHDHVLRNTVGSFQQIQLIINIFETRSLEVLYKCVTNIFKIRSLEVRHTLSSGRGLFWPPGLLGGALFLLILCLLH